MSERKDLRTSSKEGEPWSWTQRDPERKMSDDEDRYLEREEREKEGEAQSWTQKVIEGKMSDDEARHLERKEKETRNRTQEKKSLTMRLDN